MWESGLHRVWENGLHGVWENGLHGIQDAVSHGIQDGGLNGLQSTTPISSSQDKTISTQQNNYSLPIPPFSDPPCNLMQYFLLVSYTHTKMIEVTNLPINYQLPSPLPSHHTIQSIDHNIPTFSKSNMLATLFRAIAQRRTQLIIWNLKLSQFSIPLAFSFLFLSFHSVTFIP